MTRCVAGWQHRIIPRSKPCGAAGQRLASGGIRGVADSPDLGLHWGASSLAPCTPLCRLPPLFPFAPQSTLRDAPLLRTQPHWIGRTLSLAAASHVSNLDCPSVHSVYSSSGMSLLLTCHGRFSFFANLPPPIGLHPPRGKIMRLFSMQIIR